ncbi:MAG: prephenate dehydrogenase [Vampirovibrionales bacterium]
MHACPEEPLIHVPHATSFESVPTHRVPQTPGHPFLEQLKNLAQGQLSESPSSPCPYDKITVLGLGLMGGSFVMGVRARYPECHIQGMDPNPSTLQKALQEHLIHQVALDVESLSLEGTSHLVVLASHLKVNEANLQALMKHPQWGGHLILTDLGSCKRPMLQQLQTLSACEGLSESHPIFIPGHPLAGREKSGLDAATELLFVNKRWVLCPTEDVPETHPSFRTFSHFLTSLGVKVLTMPVELHDQTMALVSHLPQLYATALGSLLQEHQPARLLRYTGGGIDDQLRLTGSSHAMWQDIFLANRDHLLPYVEGLIQKFELIKDILTHPSEEALSGQPDPALASFFTDANKLYDLFQRIRA